VMKVGEHGFWVGYVNQVWNWPANGIQNPAFRKHNNLNIPMCCFILCTTSFHFGLILQWIFNFL
jgi:hypothetical protein